jgi:hypothetical protein
MKNAAAQYGFAHQRKYHDAILWGAKKVRLEFPAGYRQQMKDYLDTLAKEKTKAKEKGQVDEQEADPITFELFKKLCQWALESGNIMVWAFTILQWHCMGRSVNIAPLGFHNFSSNEASDSIVIKYDHNKKDKKGEKTSPKNCYANPFNPAICLFLSLGCYLCMYKEYKDMFTRSTDKLFRKNGKDKSPSDTYCKALKKMIESVKNVDAKTI